MNSLDRYKVELKRVKEEMKNATGYRKKDLLRKVRRMEKDIAEYQMWQKKAVV